MTEENDRVYLDDQEQRQAAAVLNCRRPLSSDQLRLVLCCLLTGPARSEAEAFDIAAADLKRKYRDHLVVMGLIDELERSGALPFELARTLREQEGQA